MPITSLREGDSLRYLRFQQQLTESTHNAIYSTGTNSIKVLPVWIRESDSALFVETDYRWVAPPSIPGFLRFEMLPAERAKQEEEKRAAEAAEAATNQKIKGSTWIEQREHAEKLARQNLAERQASHQAQNSMPAGDPALAKASYEFAQAAASRRGQRNPE